MLQGSGTIRFSNVIAEFGRAESNGGASLGRYRVSESFGSMSNLPLDTGIPQSGSIRMSDFYSKQLNCVVNYYDGSNIRRSTARNRYNTSNGNDNRVKSIGGFRVRPSNSNGTRVIIHVNKRIGSEYDGSRGMKCALRTGSWNANTNLDVNIGGSGAVIGAAGAGGKGGNRGRGHTDGKRGSSGLGVEYPIDLFNYGFLAGGGGGGGGGNGKRIDRHKRSRDYRRCGWWCDSRGRNRRKDRRRKGGGGGGGGQGFPGGAGGPGGGNGGSRGNDGSQGGHGSGGSGGGDGARRGARGGNFGGDGASVSGGGGGGHKGRSIVISGSGSVNYVVSGTIYGPVVNHPVF